MGNYFSETPDRSTPRQTYHRRNDNLELYLKDVYEKECVFKASPEEVEFIQTGIETLVQKIVDLVLANMEEFLVTNMQIGGHFNIEMKEFQKSVVEVYFPISMNGNLKQHVHVKSKKSTLIKVGSFYEGTKNHFPDEFDYIFPLFCLKESPSFFSKGMGVLYAHSAMKTVADRIGPLKYVSHNNTRHETKKIYFDKYVRTHGPADLLQFVYNNGSREERFIHVDLVPAYKTTLGNIYFMESYRYVKEFVRPKSFREELVSAKERLCVNRMTSLTENEVHFMKNVLSQKHMKVYRCLKFLINGHGDGEILTLYLNVIKARAVCYSSYLIKTMIIYHHDECKSLDTEDLGPCVLQVLVEMCKYKSTDMFPKVFHTDESSLGRAAKSFFVLPGLLSLTKSISYLYDFERFRMKSLSKQCLDSLGRNDPSNAEWFKYLDTLGCQNPSYESWSRYKDSFKPAGLAQ